MASNIQSKSAEFRISSDTAVFIQRYCGRKLDLLDIVELECYLHFDSLNGQSDKLNDAQWAAHDLIVSNEGLRKKILAAMKAEELSIEHRNNIRGLINTKSARLPTFGRSRSDS
jgi:hypothetical protein